MMTFPFAITKRFTVAQQTFPQRPVQINLALVHQHH